MKILILSLALIIGFSASLHAEVQEQKMGAVTAVKRTYKLDLNNLLNNLKQDEITKAWRSDVEELKNNELVISSKNDQYIEGKALNIGFSVMALPHGYALFVSSTNDKLTAENIRAGITSFFQTEDLANKSLSTVVLKVDNKSPLE